MKRRFMWTRLAILLVVVGAVVAFLLGGLSGRAVLLVVVAATFVNIALIMYE